jgi:F-box protein 9
VVVKVADKETVEEEDDNEDSSDEAGKPEYERQGTSCTEDLSLEELTKVGGKILILHDEILHQVFSWLPVDTYGTLAFVSPHWKHLTRIESVYRRLCERLYLNQSKRRQLYVSRFGGSYRRMLEQRPRVRAAGGCYVLKYVEVKKIIRDMWTEVSRYHYHSTMMI